uniref:ATP-dependent Clp protease proteolytic subunit n=1 Tax=Araucaria cunninghamii TaxID=56994 RepID=A0A0D6QUW2_ARACU
MQAAQAMAAPSVLSSVGNRKLAKFRTPHTLHKNSSGNQSSPKLLGLSLARLNQRKLRSACNVTNNYNPSLSSIQSEGFWSPKATAYGDIWSIRNDLEVPSSPYCSPYAQGQQGPPPMLMERFQSVISQLFQYRIIRCGGPVDDDMANLIVAQLLYLDAADPTRDIVMYINSPGGSVTAGMAVFDTMRHIRPDVATVCVGLAASMGAFLLSSGTKGKRYSLPNSRIMIHQPLGGTQGQQSDIEIQANEILHHKANLAAYLAYHTGQPLSKINQDTDRDFFMSPKEAKDYGLVDAVIMNPLKALQPLPSPPPPDSSTLEPTPA